MFKFLTIAKITVGIIVFLSFFCISYARIDPDLWWHLKTGQWELQNKEVPHFDEYSHTMPDFEWVNHEWLVDAGLSWMYLKNLWWLIALIFTSLALLPFLIWLKRSKSLINVWIIVFMAICMAGFIGVRSQIISFAVFFFVFEILYQKYIIRNQSNFYRYLFYALPFFFLLWANMHAGFFSALIVWTVFILIHYAAKWRKSENFGKRELKSDIFLLLLSAFSSLINPYGWKLYKEIFTVMFSGETMKYIIEWQPALGINHFFYIPLITVFMVFIFNFRKKYHPEIIGVSLLLMLMFLKSMRIGPLFFIAAMPVLTEGEKFLKEEVPDALRRKLLFLKTQKAPYLIINILLIFYLIPLWTDVIYKNSGYPAFAFPQKAAQFLLEENKKEKIGNILNSYGWGGYLIFNAPEIKVFIDGRMPHWTDKNGNSAMKDYVKLFYDTGNVDYWKNIFEKRKITAVLIENNEKTNEQKHLFISKYILPRIQKYAKEFRKYGFVKRLADYFLTKKPVDLSEILLKHNWKTAYKDDIAVILQCDYSCY